MLRPGVTLSHLESKKLVQGTLDIKGRRIPFKQMGDKAWASIGSLKRTFHAPNRQLLRQEIAQAFAERERVSGSVTHPSSTKYDVKPARPATVLPRQKAVNSAPPSARPPVRAPTEEQRSTMVRQVQEAFLENWKKPINQYEAINVFGRSIYEPISSELGQKFLQVAKDHVDSAEYRRLHPNQGSMRAATPTEKIAFKRY